MKSDVDFGYDYGVLFMIRLLRKIRFDKSGASAAEYALILAVVGGGIVVAAVALSGSISTAMGNAGTVISTGQALK